MGSRFFSLIAFLLMLALLSGPGMCQESVESDSRALLDIGWVMRPRQNLENAFWLVDPEVNRIVGTALWDAFQRRYTLFDKNGKYGGFMQAVTLDREPYSYHKQYLVYDENNEYRGMSIRQPGGRTVEHIRPLPFGVPSLEPPAKPKYELGGGLRLYPLGIVALPPPELNIRFFPWDIEQILDRMELPSATGR